MKILILIIISIIFYSCSSSFDELDTIEYSQNPCNDLTFQRLKNMNSKELSKSEIEYINIKDKECRDYLTDLKESNTEEKKAEKNLLWILYGLGLIIAAGIFLSFALKNGH